MGSDPRGVSVRNIPPSRQKPAPRSRSGARCPVYFQPGVTHFFPEALFQSHSLSCSAADPPGRAPSPPPPLAHPHPPPLGCPKAGTRRDDGPKTKGLFFGGGQNLPQGRPCLRAPVCTQSGGARTSACLWLHTAPGSCCCSRRGAARATRDRH